MLDGQLRIMLDDYSATENSIEVEPFQLQSDEAAQVRDGRGGVGRCQPARAGAARPPSTEIAGDSELRFDFLQGSRIHRLNREHRGPRARRPSTLDPR